jgi:DNA-binding MarR family transcriptional regulator
MQRGPTTMMPTAIFLHRLLSDLERGAHIDGLEHRAKCVLWRIAEGDLANAPVSVGELARARDLGTAPTVYAALTVLEEKGWIERLQDHVDGRAKRVYLTLKARSAFRGMSIQGSRALRGVSWTRGKVLQQRME